MALSQVKFGVRYKICKLVPKIYSKNMVAENYLQSRFMESKRPRGYNLEIRKRKFRWVNHTLRKEDGEVPKAVLLLNPQGSGKRGRPKISWRRSVTKEVGRSWNELRFLAADRQKWKELIDNVCS